MAEPVLIDQSFGYGTQDASVLFNMYADFMAYAYQPFSVQPITVFYTAGSSLVTVVITNPWTFLPQAGSFTVGCVSECGADYAPSGFAPYTYVPAASTSVQVATNTFSDLTSDGSTLFDSVLPLLIFIFFLSFLIALFKRLTGKI